MSSLPLATRPGHPATAAHTTTRSHLLKPRHRYVILRVLWLLKFAGWFLVSRMYYLLVALFGRYSAYEFDASSNLLFTNDAITEHLLQTPSAGSVAGAPMLPELAMSFARPVSLLEVVPRALMHWDAVHYFNVFRHGFSYTHEMQLPFFPLYPLFVTLLTNALAGLFPVGTPLIAMWATIGILLSNVSIAVAAALLYKLSKKLAMHTDTTCSLSAIGKLSVLMFLLQPGSIFLSGMYSEAIFCVFTFAGMLFFEDRRWFLASLCWAACSALRSNATLYVYFFAHRFLFHERHLRFFVYSLFSITPFLLLQAYHYYNFCVKMKEATSEQRPWCKQRIPLSYSYVQTTYWDVGLFRHYKREHEFDIAVSIGMLVRSLVTLWRARPTSFKDLKNPIAPYFVFQTFFTAYIFIVAHLNISVRLFSCLPLLFIPQHPSFLADKSWLVYSVLYSTLAVTIFSIQYGPT